MSAQDGQSLEVGHYSLDEERDVPGALPVQQLERPYEEGTQPPRLSNRDLTQMAAVVGGQAVRRQQPKQERTGQSLDPKQATHGEPSDGPSAMELGKQVMTMDLHAQKDDPSGLPGIPTNQRYQEPSQFPKAGSSAVGHIPDAVAGQKISQPSSFKSIGSGDSGASQRSGKPEIEIGEAVSAVVPDVQGREDAARAAKQDLQNVTSHTSQPDLQRVSEEQVTPDTAAQVDQQRPTADPSIAPETSATHVSGLLGNSQTAQKQPKGGLPQLPPKKRTGTAKIGRKSKALLPSTKNENRTVEAQRAASKGKSTRWHHSGKTGARQKEEALEDESWSAWLASNAFLAGGVALAGTAALTAVIIWRHKRS